MEKFYLLDFPTCSDSRGQLTSLEQNLCIPFEINGINYVLDIDSNIHKAFCKIDEKFLAEIINGI